MLLKEVQKELTREKLRGISLKTLNEVQARVIDQLQKLVQVYQIKLRVSVCEYGHHQCCINHAKYN